MVIRSRGARRRRESRDGHHSWERGKRWQSRFHEQLHAKTRGALRLEFPGWPSASWGLRIARQFALVRAGQQARTNVHRSVSARFCRRSQQLDGNGWRRIGKRLGLRAHDGGIAPLHLPPNPSPRSEALSRAGAVRHSSSRCRIRHAWFRKRRSAVNSGCRSGRSQQSSPRSALFGEARIQLKRQTASRPIDAARAIAGSASHAESSRSPDTATWSETDNRRSPCPGKSSSPSATACVSDR